MQLRASPLSGMDGSFLDALHRRWRADPASVEPSWAVLFATLEEAEAAPRPGDAALAREIRDRGHLAARLDPLGLAQGRLELAVPPDAAPEALAARYCGTLGLESAHVDDPALRAWLHAAFEGLAPPAAAARVQALRDLIACEGWEGFLGRRFPTKKRFGAEGSEALLPLLRAVLAEAAAQGVTHAVIGTMHRGRMALMTMLLGRDPARMLAEIKGAHPFPADPPRAGDVPYHLGLETLLDLGGREMRVILLPNPSHLEAVDPVALGRARALQDSLGPGGAGRVLPVLLHTDAAVVAQGVVAETIQLALPPGFSTGGTVHIVVNNQIGFTTAPEEARSSRHCTGPWKATDSAILHVNADDPDAVLGAAALAIAWRQRHGRDAVVDLVGYRRNGHNEIDEPRFTQPRLYETIARHPPVTTTYAQRLLAEGLVPPDFAEGEAAAVRRRLEEAYDAAAGLRLNESGYPGGAWSPHGDAAGAEEPDTGIPPERLTALAGRLSEPPVAAPNPKLERLLRQRAAIEGGIPWPLAEALAFASLLEEGTPVRHTGQDVVRGAFSQRHFAVFDTRSGEARLSLNALGPGQAPFMAHNSPLSEYAVLGFEYGYSLGRPEALTVWEAQFGDFANGAQIILDQFIAAAEEKWCLPSGLVVLLPHGLEGQGPEHSSARIERLLLLAARDNLRIASPSTPANLFHLLRRQALHPRRKPLILIGTKKLLRLPAAVSAPAEFAPGTRFRPVLCAAPVSPRRVLLCSGKVAYELEEERARRGAADVAILRLERLCPLPKDELAALVARWPAAEWRWVQEEPENMGAWPWLDRRLERLRRTAGAAVPEVAYVGRAESPSPSGSFHTDHDADQARLVAAAFE